MDLPLWQQKGCPNFSFLCALESLETGKVCAQVFLSYNPVLKWHDSSSLVPDMRDYWKKKNTNSSISLLDSKPHLRHNILYLLEQIAHRMIGCKSDLPLRNILNWGRCNQTSKCICKCVAEGKMINKATNRKALNFFWLKKGIKLVLCVCSPLSQINLRGLGMRTSQLIEKHWWGWVILDSHLLMATPKENSFK